MDDILVKIENEDEFRQLIGALRDMTFAPLDYFFTIRHTIDDERVALAYRKYKLEIDRFSEYLHSGSPDHYKRCGALLYALCTNPVVTGHDIPYTAEDVDAGYSQIPLGDAPYVVEALKFYEEYYDVFAAWDLCMKICMAYEGRKKVLDFDVIHNICHYLKQNNLSSDSYFILFRALMA